MEIRDFEIPDVKLIIPKRFGDSRGYFSESWSDRTFRDKVANMPFVQDNQSVSAKKGTIRGLHFQRPPFAQGKLVRVVRGSILDIVVDIRVGSPAYKKHLALQLVPSQWAQLWIPPGFLHGFCTLEDDTEVFYKVTDYYSPEHDAGVAWNDPELDIMWPVNAKSATISIKDQQHPSLRQLPGYFNYKKLAE